MIKGSPSKDTIIKILGRLSRDNDFREHFLGDPAGALKEYGVEVDPERVPAVRKLPSKDRIVEMHKQVGTESEVDKVGLVILLLK